jgi:hypothetical protein
MQDYSISFINAAIILVAMAVVLSISIIETKKTIWTRLLNKAPYILGGLLVIAAIILENEKISKTIFDPPRWLWIEGCIMLVALVIGGAGFLYLMKRGDRIGRQEN